ncbi:hypothetical protein ACFCV3_06830 [Kribbella sp. NPDC056345]|uniref:hypothetical protein n=1 Tax=Kribbella sp. NPDC056345 TaxID=3345789 RepID=UPI0035DB7712
MPKLTDDQLGDLLRETFADHEADTNSLPKATKRRPLVPVLVAAAAVLAVVAGSVSTIRHSEQPPPVAASTPPGASVAHASDAALWAMAVRRIAQEHEPAGGWKAVRLYDATSGPRSSPPLRSDRLQTEASVAIVPDAAERQQITEDLRDLPSVAWAEGNPSACPRDVAEVMVLPIRQEKSRRTIKVTITYGCTTFKSFSVSVS